MKLTPLDIKKQEFRKVMRGYDPVEVDTFMDMLSNELTDVLREQKDTRDRIIELETQLRDYRQIEKTLQQTLLQAQEATGRTYEAARREAEVTIREAENRASRIVEEAHGEQARLRREIDLLKGKKESLIGRLRVLLSSELDLLNTLDLGGEEALLPPADRPDTGNDDIRIDEILKNMEDDRSTQAH
jgi:cell division initiation protein